MVGEYWLPICCRRLKNGECRWINKFLSHVSRLNIHAKQLGLSPKCNQKKSQTCHAGIKSFQIFIDFTKRNCQSNTMKFAKMSDFIFQQRRNFFSMSIKSNFAKWFKVRQIWSKIKIILSFFHINHILYYARSVLYYSTMSWLLSRDVALSQKTVETRLNGGHNLSPPAGWNRVNLSAQKLWRLSWVINGWWHRLGSFVYGCLFWFLLNQHSAAQ